ncbi:MAG TPA: DUF494 family protein, partial [Arenimonas sp.]|nr:DUF494 family protein [Arenimonas sp.]
LYLFEHYLYDDPDAVRDRDSLQSGVIAQGLQQAGFSPSEINKAFDWLDVLGRDRTAPAPGCGKGPIRVFAESECDRLDAECRGFLTVLEHAGVIDAEQRELAIDQVMALEQDAIDLDDLKWVLLMVLFNQPGAEAAFAWMESQMLEDEPEPVH